MTAHKMVQYNVKMPAVTTQDSDTNCIPLPNAKEAVFIHISITQEAADKIQIETKHSPNCSCGTRSASGG